MFGRWLRSAEEVPTTPESREILALFRQYLPGADAETWRVVAAIAGLLAAVAYADRTYTDEEDAHVRAALERVHGLPSAGVDAISQTLRRHAPTLSAVELPRFARDLREFGDNELRLEVLSALVGLAAADGELGTAEVNLLRHITSTLGLSQSDYNHAQAEHRAKLAVLKS